MKKQIGNALALYPTPLVVVGTMVNGKPNWVLVGHVGETGKLSINIVDENLLPLADRAGCISGAKEDKSDLFAYMIDDSGVPMIEKAPIVMECSVDDTYVTEGFESFICKIDRTFAEERVLNEQGKIDYHTLKPVLFEMPTYEYLATGDVIGKCMALGKKD